MGGVPPYHDREREFDRYPPPRGELYGRPRDDPYERYPPPRDRDRFGAPRDFYGPARDSYPPLHPHDRYHYDYPPPRGRGSPPPAIYDRDGPPERDHYFAHEDHWEREKRAGLAPPPRSEGSGGGEGRSVDMEIIVINRQQRYGAHVTIAIAI